MVSTPKVYPAKGFDHYSDFLSSGWLIKSKGKIKEPFFDRRNRQRITSTIIPSENNILFNISYKQYYLPFKLKHIVEQIEDSKEVLKYKFDWDQNGADATDLQTFFKAIDFLVDYCKHIFDKQERILKAPFIDIMRDGSISIKWDTDKGVFFIIFKKDDNPMSYFYAERKGDNVPFKSAVRNNSVIDIHLTDWMKDFLT